MRYHFMVHKDTDGFWAECCELSGCKAQSDTEQGLEAECKEALNLYLEEPGDSRIIFPLPDPSLSKDDTLLSVSVEPEIALAVLLRHHRYVSKMTQKEVSDLLGMKNVYSYQRLEKKSNPSLRILKKIRSVFPDITFDYIFS